MLNQILSTTQILQKKYEEFLSISTLHTKKILYFRNKVNISNEYSLFIRYLESGKVERYNFKNPKDLLEFMWSFEEDIDMLHLHQVND